MWVGFKIFTNKDLGIVWNVVPFETTFQIAFYKNLNFLFKFFFMF
jgi:hypothetical protein